MVKLALKGHDPIRVQDTVLCISYHNSRIKTDTILFISYFGRLTPRSCLGLLFMIFMAHFEYRGCHA